MKYQSFKDQQLRRVFATRAEFAAWRDRWENAEGRILAGFRNAFGPSGSPDENPPITSYQRERIRLGWLDYDYLTPSGWNSTPEQVPERDIEVRLIIMGWEEINRRKVSA